MAGQFITYVTQAQDRWDLLAWRYYGDASLFSPIIQTNPAIPIEAVFEAGLNIGIPLLMVSDSIQPSGDLPPWKR